MERNKINDRFTFELELNMNMYLESELKDENINNYELFAVIIHKGDAYGGHYHIYLRDVLSEGDLEGLL